MSFIESAEDVRLEDDHILVAQLQNEDGEMQEASIDLNTCIGNNDGMFVSRRGYYCIGCRSRRLTIYLLV